MNPGKGSVFSAVIPQQVVKEEPLGDFSQKYQKYLHTAEKKDPTLLAPDARILVVDDVEMNLKVAKSFLKQTKARVDTAFSGEECLRMIRRDKYDMIFLDHMMPDMDGIETLKGMQQSGDHLNTETPVIMLTANAVVGAKENYLEEGFTNYLPKPIRERELMEMLRRYLPEELIKKKRIQGRGTRSLWIHKSGAESRRPQSRKTRNERMWNSMLIQRNRSPWRGVSQVLIFRWQWAIA